MRLLEAAQQVLAEAVVLEQHGDLGLRLFGLEELRVGLGLGHVVGLPARRVRVRGDVRAPGRGAGGDVQLRDLALVRVVPDRQVVRRAERVEQREDLLLLDQPAGVGDRALGLVAVVERDELDLAPVDAALGVLGREARLDARGDARVGRRRPAERVGAAELDRRLGDARRRRGALVPRRLRRRPHRPARTRSPAASPAPAAPARLTTACSPPLRVLGRTRAPRRRSRPTTPVGSTYMNKIRTPP